VNWDAKGTLPLPEWPDEPLVPRTVADLQKVLQEGESPFLLGTTQALVDGARVFLIRPEPQNALIRSLWWLLPASNRREVCFSSFAFGLLPERNFQSLPELPATVPTGYLDEERVLDYPESRYERSLQIAVESGDQRAINLLLGRRSARETLRLALWMIGGMFVLLVLAHGVRLIGGIR
jgi:hypothetical protein